VAIAETSLDAQAEEYVFIRYSPGKTWRMEKVKRHSADTGGEA